MQPLNPHFRRAFPWLMLLLALPPVGAFAMNFEPPVFYRPPLERLFIGATRWEKSSAYFVNLGLPGEFFEGVEKISEIPQVQSIRAVEYGLRAGGWPTDRVFVQGFLPYESVYMVPTAGTYYAKELKKGGDFELSGAYLLLGSRKTPFYAGLNGWYRFPTGTNPFDLPYPLMSSGKGAPQWAFGAIGAQKAGRFYFFQGLNYENTGAIRLPSFFSWDNPASFQWPGVLHAAARFEFQFFKRSYRSVNAFYDLRLRRVGPLKYGDAVLVEADRLYYSSFGLFVKVDPELTVTGQYSFFPFEFTDIPRPDWGGLLFLSVAYTPL
jgi:hypothetical protein